MTDTLGHLGGLFSGILLGIVLLPTIETGDPSTSQMQATMTRVMGIVIMAFFAGGLVAFYTLR